MKKIILGLIIILTISCDETSKSRFSLKGETKNMKNGTFLYLKNNLTRKIIDSTIVIDNTFKFETEISETPILAILHDKKFSNYRFLWLENNPMTFTETKSGFRLANVTGSVADSLNQKLTYETESLSRSESLKKAMSYVEENPNNIHSAYVLSVYSTTWGKEKTKYLFENFSADNKNSEYGESIAKYITVNINPKVGEKYIDFEMKNTAGEIKKISDLKGKIILLEFWAAGCRPCRQENPNLIKTYNKFKSKGFEIFAVSQDTNKEDWLTAIKKDKLPWTNVCDLKGSNNLGSLIYGIKAIPNNFLINREGIIISKNIRGKKLNEKLNELLK